MPTSHLERPALYLLFVALVFGAMSPVLLYIGLNLGGVGGHGGDWTVWAIGLGCFFASWACLTASVTLSFLCFHRGVRLKWWSIIAAFIFVLVSILGVWALRG